MDSNDKLRLTNMLQEYHSMRRERLEEDVRAIKAAKAVVIACGYIWGELGEALLRRKQAELDLMRGNAPRQ